MADPPGVGAGSGKLVESRAGAGKSRSGKREPSLLAGGSFCSDEFSGRSNTSSPWQEEGAGAAVRERGHAGLAALTEAGDGHAGQCWLWQLKGW